MQNDAFGLEFRPNNNPIELRVDDVEAARAELESRGVAFKADTLDSGVCHQAFFDSPNPATPGGPLPSDRGVLDATRQAANRCARRLPHSRAEP